MHTNYDIAAGCMGDLAAGLIGIKGAPLKITERINAGNTEVCLGIGKVGELDREYTLKEFIIRFSCRPNDDIRIVLIFHSRHTNLLAHSSINVPNRCGTIIAVTVL